MRQNEAPFETIFFKMFALQDGGQVPLPHYGGHSRNQPKGGRNSINITILHAFLTTFLSLYAKRVQKAFQRTLTAVTRGVFMLLMSTLRLQGRCSLSVKNLRFFIKITLNRRQNLSILMRNMQILG